MKNRFLLIILISIFSSLVFAEAETRTFTLRGDAQQIQQTINNLYGDQARISLINHQLAVRAEPAVLDQIAKLLGDIDSAPTMLSISLSSAPQNSTTISTRSHNDVSNLRTESGKTITLSKARTRQQPVIGAWYQMGIEEAPIDEETLIITPQLMAGEVRVEISYRNKQDSRASVGSQTVTGKPGEWMALIGGNTHQDEMQNTTISTRKSSIQNTSELWIKINVIE